MARLQTNNRYVIFGVWWVALVCVHVWVLYQRGFTAGISATDGLVSDTILAGFCFLISNNMRYYLPQREKYWYLLIVSLVLSGLALLLSKWILGAVVKDSVYQSFLHGTLSLRFAFFFLLIGYMAMLSLLWQTQKEQAKTEQRKADAERLWKEAELYNLRQQLQPHFLFNSLNSISALAGSQPEKARHMIQQLSDFLRGTLQQESQRQSSLTEEMEHLQLYLDIEKVRFGHRLQTEIDYDEVAGKMLLPSMLLQPVVENAIKFGLYDTLGEVTISIRAKGVGNDLQIVVSNPYDAETFSNNTGTGFGLASVKRRLYLVFSRNDLLQTSRNDSQFITQIIIPQIRYESSTDR